MNKIKIIYGVKVPPLFYDKSFFKVTFIAAMIGLAGIAISLGSYVICFHDSIENISSTDIWELLVISLFLFAMFLPTSLILYFSYTIMKIVENMAEKSTNKTVNTEINRDEVME